MHLFEQFSLQMTKKALFTGDSEIDQLYRVFRTLGTPDEDSWPGVSKLPDYKSTFPKWQQLDLEKAVPALSEDGVDLLKVSYRCDQNLIATVLKGYGSMMTTMTMARITIKLV